MTRDNGPDWSPETYARFRGLRLRPALDLMAQIHALPEGPVIDLGCGNGAAGAALQSRFGRPVIGVDRSPAMLEAARATGDFSTLEAADIADWTADTPPALIFSNAACHWLPDHPALFSRLAGELAPGGTLAVQMPRQHGAPSHHLLRTLSEQLFPTIFDWSGWVPPVGAPVDYLGALSHLGRMDVWETQYIQKLEPAKEGHPVRVFTQATAMRPITEKLDPDQTARFVEAYDIALQSAYPLGQDGSAYLPFRRLFFTLTV